MFHENSVIRNRFKQKNLLYFMYFAHAFIVPGLVNCNLTIKFIPNNLCVYWKYQGYDIISYSYIASRTLLRLEIS